MVAPSRSPELRVALDALLEEPFHFRVDLPAFEACELLQIPEFLVHRRRTRRGLDPSLRFGRYVTVGAREAQFHDHRAARGERGRPGGLLCRRDRHRNGGRLLQWRAGARLALRDAARDSKGLHERLALGFRKLLEHLQLLGGRRLLRNRSRDRGAERRELSRNLCAGRGHGKHGHEPGQARPAGAPARDVLH